MTVEQAVLKVIIDHVVRGERRIKNCLIETAHPQHNLSGRARLRGLRGRGLVKYKFCDEDNTYEIYSTLQELEDAWQVLTGKLTSIIVSGTKPVTPIVQKKEISQTVPYQSIKKDENLTVFDIDEGERLEMLVAIKQFREELNKKANV